MYERATTIGRNVSAGAHHVRQTDAVHHRQDLPGVRKAVRPRLLRRAGEPVPGRRAAVREQHPVHGHRRRVRLVQTAVRQAGGRVRVSRRPQREHRQQVGAVLGAGHRVPVRRQDIRRGDIQSHADDVRLAAQTAERRRRVGGAETVEQWQFLLLAVHVAGRPLRLDPVRPATVEQLRARQTVLLEPQPARVLRSLRDQYVPVADENRLRQRGDQNRLRAQQASQDRHHIEIELQEGRHQVQRAGLQRRRFRRELRRDRTGHLLGRRSHVFRADQRQRAVVLGTARHERRGPQGETVEERRVVGRRLRKTRQVPERLLREYNFRQSIGRRQREQQRKRIGPELRFRTKTFYFHVFVHTVRRVRLSPRVQNQRR